MIDTHCHLEQSDYDTDRAQVVAACQAQLHAVVTSCAHPAHLDTTLQLVHDYPGFVFAAASIHPRYVNDFSDDEVHAYLDRLRAHRTHLVAIGETGLDHNWITDAPSQAKQRRLFIRMITLAHDLDLPLVIHSRDATDAAIQVLEDHHASCVQMHMFTSRPLLPRVLHNHWRISVNTLLLRSKTVKKLVRDCPLDHLMLETDAPWLGVGADGKLQPKHLVRNTPTAVHQVAKKIADIKHLPLTRVDEQTTANAIAFFHLPLQST
jgi:TatD DNase family protein